MSRLLIAVSLLVIFPVFADKNFEINKKNCNLPIKKIRDLIPEKAKQESIYRQCAKKASAENWTQKSLANK